jgi:hypothetical protein
MEDEKAPPADDISRDELQDLADVALASSVPESMFLTGVLEDAGIPPVTRSDNLWGLSGGTTGTIRILVPRVMLERAKSEIDKARVQAEQQRVEGAFEEHTVADLTADAATDAVLDKMLLFRELEMTERVKLLEPYAAGWLKDGSQPAEIAKYLSAAGLTIQQSGQFLEEMKAKYAQNISESREGYKVLGTALIALALLMTIVSVVAKTVRPTAVIVVSFAVGLALIFNSKRPLPTIKAASASDDKPAS